MRNLILLGIAVAGLGLSACGGKTGELEALEKRACACKDRTCAEAVEKDLEKITESMKDSDVNQGTAKALGGIASCLLKLESLDDEK